MPNSLIPNAKPRQGYHHGDLRAALIRTGVARLEAAGTAELSLRQLAKSLGVSPSAPYRHFPTRDLLLEAIAVEGYHRLTDLLDRPNLTVPEAADRVEGFARDHAGWWALMVGRSADAGSDLEAARGAFLAELVGVVERAAPDAEPEEAIRLAVGIWALLVGIARLRTGGGMSLLDESLTPTAGDLAAAVVSGRPLGGAAARRRRS